jgi:hypothetical protein
MTKAKVKVTEDERERIRAHYLEAKSITITAHAMGRSISVVHRAVRDLTGIGRVGRPPGSRTRHLTEIERESVALALLYEESTGSIPWKPLSTRAGCSVDELRYLVAREKRRG